MGEYNKNIKTSILRFRPNKKLYRMMSGLSKISSKDELALYNKAAFFSLLAPILIFVLNFIYKAGNKDLYDLIMIIFSVAVITMVIYSILKRKKIPFILIIIAIIIIVIFCIYKVAISEFLNPIINSLIICNWYIVTGVVVLVIFFYSLKSISSLMRISNKKLFIGLIKYSVGCSLMAIYIGFFMVGAGNIEAKNISDIISNITVLITSLFFFIDGMHDTCDYLDEKDNECRNRSTYKKYMEFGINKKYIFKRIIFYKRMHIWLYFCILYISIIDVCNMDFSNIDFNKEKYIITGVLFIVLPILLAIIVLPFGDAYINFIKEYHESDDKDINFFEDKMRESMSIDKPIKFNPRYILGNFIVNRIFEDIEIHNDELISEEEKKFYFERYIKVDATNVMKIEYDDIVNCQWYTISNKKDKFIGDGVVLNKDNRSYIFVFVTPLKRGKGFGTLILKELEKKVETEERYIQIRDKIRNKEMKTFMLSKNDYIKL